LDRELVLPPEVSSLLAGRLRKAEALLDIIQGKRSLFANDSQKAYDFLSRANASSPTLKLRILLAGLQTMPHLTLMAARMWSRLTRI
jgi:hypothetical protein